MFLGGGAASPHQGELVCGREPRGSALMRPHQDSFIGRLYNNAFAIYDTFC